MAKDMAGHGRGRSRGHGRGHGTCLTDDSGDHSETIDIDHSLPGVEGTWEDEQPNSLLCTFAATRASNVLVTDDTTAADFYCSYFIDEVWVLLVTETNRYAQTNFSDKPSACAWTDVTVEEMKAFIGLLIIMRVVKLPFDFR